MDKYTDGKCLLVVRTYFFKDFIGRRDTLLFLNKFLQVAFGIPV